MKILFIVNTEDLGFEEPLGVLYLSAVSKKRRHEVYAVKNNLADIQSKLRDIKPDLLAVSVTTPSFPYLSETVRLVKARFDIPAVFGGPHITFFPEVAKNEEINYAFRGECEEAFMEFLDLLETGKPVLGVDNLIFKERDMTLKINPLRPLIQDLDCVPFPDRDLLSGYKEFYELDVRSVMASRGCPYNCSYCFNKEYKLLYKDSYNGIRLRSVDNVVAECAELKYKYGVKMIHFFDDIFPSRNDWLQEFAQKYHKSVGLPFFTNTHFEVCSEEYVRNLSNAGCKALLIGVESGNEQIREKILHRKMSNKFMLQKSDLIHSYGIKIYTQNIIGLPFGDLKNDLETLKLNIDLKADFAGAYLCQAYPKTEIERLARQSGLIEENHNLGRSFYYSSPFKLPDKKKVEKLRMIFAFIANFPFLFSYTDRLIQSPDFFLKIFACLLHGYKIKTVVLQYKMGLGVFLKNIRIFFSRRINSVFYGASKQDY